MLRGGKWTNESVKGKKPINGVLSSGLLTWQLATNLTRGFWETVRNMPPRYPNRGEKELRFISISSSIIVQGMLPGAWLPPCLLALYNSQAKTNPLGGGNGTWHRMLSACFWNSECWSMRMNEAQTICYTSARMLVFILPYFFNTEFPWFISVLYLFSSETNETVSQTLGQWGNQSDTTCWTWWFQGI